MPRTLSRRCNPWRRLLLLCLVGVLCAGAEPKPPNVVFIIADDMSTLAFDDPTAGLQIPHLDRLRSESVEFARAVCNAPSCVPSRGSFLSGLYPFTTGSYLNGSDPWEKPVMAQVDTLPEQFKRAGYTVWGAGKLFHSKITAERRAAAFDNVPHAGGFGPFVYEEDQLAGKWWGASAWRGPDSDFPDVVNTDGAVAFLEQSHEQPFLLMLGLWRPHTPFTAPSRHFAAYDPARIPLPPHTFQADDLDDVPPMGHRLSAVWGERWEKTGGDHPEAWRRILHGYYATTRFADEQVGRVLDALEASGHADDTIVVFFSDNGYHLGEKNHFEKSTLWSASARVPLMVRLPGAAGGGRRSLATVGLIDVFPTLADYCGLPAPRQALQGFSLRKLLEDDQADWSRPGITVYEEGHFSATDGRYRYIRYADGTEELYDQIEDPHEWHNLAGDPAGAAVKQRFQKWIPQTWAPSLGGREG